MNFCQGLLQRSRRNKTKQKSILFLLVSSSRLLLSSFPSFHSHAKPFSFIHERVKKWKNFIEAISNIKEYNFKCLLKPRYFLYLLFILEALIIQCDHRTLNYKKILSAITTINWLDYVQQQQQHTKSTNYISNIIEISEQGSVVSTMKCCALLL